MSQSNLLHHQSNAPQNPKEVLDAQFAQKGAKSTSNKEQRTTQVQHQRQFASHFATQDNRMPSSTDIIISGRQTENQQRASIGSQPYTSVG